MSDYLFSSESVSEGHPDKIADQISDALTDAILAQGPRTRAACETLVKDNRIVLAGEIRADSPIDADGIARQVVRDIGYNRGRPRLLRRHLRHPQPSRPPVARHRRRSRPRRQRPRRGRPGHYVWLRMRRDGIHDAAAD